MKKAGDLVREIIDKCSQGVRYLGIFKGWDDLVGQDLASHTKVKDIEQGYVLVEVDHPGWMYRLQLKERRILKSIRLKYPELDIKGLKLYLKTIDNAK